MLFLQNAYSTIFLLLLGMVSSLHAENPFQTDTQALLTKAVFDITHYGISPNSSQDAVPAILGALKDAQAYVKSTNQNAEIFIPTGKYNISQFQISGLDNIILHLDQNAELHAYPKNSSINASAPYITIENGNNFVFVGKAGSLLDGAGESWWSSNDSRPEFIHFENLTNYKIHGFTVSNSPFHTIELYSCQNGIMHNLTILAPADSPNTDGIDPMGNISGLEIYNCTFSNGDDAVAINSVSGKMENIHVHDCTITSGHGFSIGSAVKYDINNLLVENMSIQNTWCAIRLKFKNENTAAQVSNFQFNNFTAANLSRDAIQITTNYNGPSNKKISLKNISISNFTCTGADRGLNLTVYNKSQVINPIVLHDVTITGAKNKDIIKNCPINKTSG